MTPTAPAHAIHLRLVERVALDPTKVSRFVHDEDGAWLGTREPSPQEGVRRFLTDLALPVREKAPRVVFKKAAFVDLGEVRTSPDGFELQISWRSSSLAPLFPVFAGHLPVAASEIRLEGYYAPPGGEFGVALDRAFLNIAARGTARWLLERATDALAVEAKPA